MQERCARNKGNGCREVLAAVRKHEIIGRIDRFLIGKLFLKSQMAKLTENS